MKINKLFFCIILSVNLHGQQTELWILGYKGSISINNDSANLSRYSKIAQNASIIIGADASLELLKAIGNECYTCTINEKNIYSFNDLSSKCLKDEKRMGFEHWKYVYENLLKHEKEIPLEGTIGGVYRALGDELMIYPINGSVIVKNSILFSWQKSDKVKSYFFSIRGEDQNEIITLELSDTCIVFHDTNSLFAKGETYNWTVQIEMSELESFEPNTFTFKIPNRDWVVKFNNDLALYKKDLLFKPQENEYLLGVFYEKYGLYMNALDSFIKAKDLSGGENFYVESLDLFAKSKNF